MLVAARSPAAAPLDLSKVDRSLRREPTYAGKPQYCLLLFGRAARTKVWLALDGDVLYADLNANGDRTEAGERFSPQNRRRVSSAYRDWKYQLGQVDPMGEQMRHTRFEITAYQVSDEPLCHVLCVWVNDTWQQYAGWGPIFASSRETAPLIHFGAPVICKPLRHDSIRRTATAPEIHLCFSWKAFVRLYRLRNAAQRGSAAAKY